MKILHTADWHLGKYLGDFSRLEEQKEVLAEIVQIAEEQQVDAVLVAGDIYDHVNPSIEATELLFKTFKQLTRGGKCPVVAIAGNHDSPDRIQAPDPLAKACGIFFFGYPYTEITPIELETQVAITQCDKGFIEVYLPQCQQYLRLVATAYANEHRLKTYLGTENKEDSLRAVLQNHWQVLADKYCDNKGVNMLMAHLFMIPKAQENELPDEDGDEEKSILYVGGSQPIFTESIPPQMQYVALGHLHRHFFVTQKPCPAAYSSSPLAYSFAEANQQKYVVMVEAEPDKPIKYEKIALQAGRPLQKKTFENVDEAIAWLEQNPKALVSLTLISESYISAKDRKAVFKAHNGIVEIKPDFKQGSPLHKAQKSSIDITKSTEELFVDFFKSKHNEQTPDEALMNLLKEVMNE